MILFLRDKKKRSIVDCECYIKKDEKFDDNSFIEISVSIDIRAYSELLLSKFAAMSDEIINDFTELSELRGWLWESYFIGEDNDSEKYSDVIRILREMFIKVAEKYDLYYIED